MVTRQSYDAASVTGRFHPNQGLPMKCPPLLPQVALVLAVAYACSDSAGPGNSHALVAPTDLAGVIGKPPPPPVSTVIAVSIQSPGEAVFTGVFFNNGLIHEDGLAVDPTLDGTAWLRFDNKQPDLGPFSGTTSPNARFMVHGDNPPTGNGTLTIGTVTYRIVSVQRFTRFPGCGVPEEGAPPSPCAEIEFMAEIVGGGACNSDNPGNCHEGDLVAFDKSSCLSEGDGGFSYDFDECPLPDSGGGE
jgi:hypothetical protein